MDKGLMAIGTVAGLGGALLCLVAVVVRLSGSYWLAGMQVGTLLLGGTAAMTAGCLAFLAVLARRALAGR